MSEIKKRQDRIIEDFSLFEDWMQRYEYIIDLGKKLPPLDDKDKNNDTLVEGCTSRAWITAEVKDGKIYYRGDGEAVISKGLLYLLFDVVNGLTPEEVADADFYFLKEIGLTSHLSPSRTNGLMSMVDKIKTLAKQLKG